MKTIEFSGVFELEPKGYGFIRKISKEFHRDSSDIYVPSGTIQDIGLRDGCLVTGTAREKNGQYQVASSYNFV